jgi:hypothetical protein
LRGGGDASVHAEGFRKSSKLGLIGGVCGGLGAPFDALKENAEFRVTVLIGMEDVAAIFEDPAGGLRD